MNEIGGHRHDVSIALTGLDVEAKADILSRAFWASCPTPREDFAEVSEALVRTDKIDPASNAEATAQWRLTLKDPDERKLGRRIFDSMTGLALANIPGFYGLSMGSAKPYGVYTPALVDRDVVPQHVVILGGERTVVESTTPADVVAEDIATPSSPGVAVPTGPTIDLPLGTIVGARSGDKGGNANIGVFCRSETEYVWLEDFLTIDRMRELLPEAAELEIERWPMPSFLSMNFLIHGILQEGVAASTRQDGQAKSLGEWLRARIVPIPEALTPAAS